MESNSTLTQLLEYVYVTRVY